MGGSLSIKANFEIAAKEPNAATIDSEEQPFKASGFRSISNGIYPICPFIDFSQQQDDPSLISILLSV
jgi:hypothetical protein